MTDNEKLARWQGWKVQPRGKVTPHIPDYLNDDAAAMSLLDTLVEKWLLVILRVADSNTRLWRVAIYDKYYDTQLVEIKGKPTRREAVVAAVLELIERETLSGKEDV